MHPQDLVPPVFKLLPLHKITFPHAHLHFQMDLYFSIPAKEITSTMPNFLPTKDSKFDRIDFGAMGPISSCMMMTCLRLDASPF